MMSLENICKQLIESNGDCEGISCIGSKISQRVECPMFMDEKSQCKFAHNNKEELMDELKIYLNFKNLV